MNWINPKYLYRQSTDDGVSVNDIYLATDPDVCVFGRTVRGFDSQNNAFNIHFPGPCSDLASILLTDGAGMKYVSSDAVLPFHETVAIFNRENRTFILGQSWDGDFYVYCMLDKKHGFLAAV